jgi:hypothetical protein
MRWLVQAANSQSLWTAAPTANLENIAASVSQEWSQLLVTVRSWCHSHIVCFFPLRFIRIPSTQQLACFASHPAFAFFASLLILLVHPP